jgi:NAD(P)-dependent dehydrogenase (short-subunit alcohol dehydrogenase family)
LVTGAGRGIGRAVALDLARHGASVVVADSGTGIGGAGEDGSVAEAVAREIGPNALAVPGDVSAPGAAHALVQAALDAFGALDILVNNAAILRPGLLFKSDEGDWDRTIEINLNAAAHLVQAASPVMRRQFKEGRAWGRIIAMGSTVGLLGNPGQGAYAASKAGLFALMRVAALELAPSRVTANFVAPFAGTRVSESLAGNGALHAAHQQRMRALGPEHVAPVVSWLASDLAADVSGQVVEVRGRQVTLYSQPRPVATIAAEGALWDPAELDRAARASFAPNYADLVADRERFVERES